jgi:hypothetical protein
VLCLFFSLYFNSTVSVGVTEVLLKFSLNQNVDIDLKQVKTAFYDFNYTYLLCRIKAVSHRCESDLISLKCRYTFCWISGIISL